MILGIPGTALKRKAAECWSYETGSFGKELLSLKDTSGLF